MPSEIVVRTASMSGCLAGVSIRTSEMWYGRSIESCGSATPPITSGSMTIPLARKAAPTSAVSSRGSAIAPALLSISSTIASRKPCSDRHEHASHIQRHMGGIGRDARESVQCVLERDATVLACRGRHEGLRNDNEDCDRQVAWSTRHRVLQRAAAGGECTAPPQTESPAVASGGDCGDHGRGVRQLGVQRVRRADSEVRQVDNRSGPEHTSPRILAHTRQVRAGRVAAPASRSKEFPE